MVCKRSIVCSADQRSTGNARSTTGWEDCHEEEGHAEPDEDKLEAQQQKRSQAQRALSLATCGLRSVGDADPTPALECRGVHFRSNWFKLFPISMQHMQFASALLESVYDSNGSSTEGPLWKCAEDDEDASATNSLCLALSESKGGAHGHADSPDVSAFAAALLLTCARQLPTCISGCTRLV